MYIKLYVSAGDGGLNGGQIAAIVVTAVVLLFITITTVMILICLKREFIYNIIL